MNRWHNDYVDHHAHFCTASVADRKPRLVGEAIRVLYEAWDNGRTALGVRVLAYVVMPDHYHTILWAEKGRSIAAFLQRTASLTAKRLQPGGGFWKERPRVLPIYSRGATKLDYIHRNPLARGLVTDPEDWIHSSYRELVCRARDVPFACDEWQGISV